MKSEWLESLKHIENALIYDFYHPVGDISFEGFVTDAELSLCDAEKLDRKLIKTNDVFGEATKYAWLFARFRLGDECAGERIIMNLDPGGEATIFLGGKPFGTRRADFISHPHHYFVDQTVAKSALGGEEFELACEVYCGHAMPRQSGGSCSTGPVFPEKERDILQYTPPTMGENSYGIFNEEAYQLYLDILVLTEVMQCNDKNSFRVEAIEYGLKELIITLDMELPLEVRRVEYKKMSEMLRPLLLAKNGSSAPQIDVVANSHLDVAWMWDFGETRRKTARTFAAQLRLLKEYPEATFIQSQPITYEMCREHYPEIFDEIVELSRSGQWIADGAMWVEPDTNLSSGESLIRQFLYGKRYFKEYFDKDSRLCWLPDTFGYTAALPQILKGCGVDYFTTQKIFWTYNESEKFPFHAFSWQGMDGTKIESYVHMKYETPINPETVISNWNNRMERDGTGRLFMPFGYGDGGGGPTRDDMEQIRRTKDLEGTPKIAFTTPYDFMSDLKATTSVFERNIYVGELYFPCHRGTYTTQSNVKKGNRKAEIALHDAELWNTLAFYGFKDDYPSDDIEKCWKNVLLNQFHDILPGSSIEKVYQDAAELYNEVFEKTDIMKKNAQNALTKQDDGITFFNGTSFERACLVYLPSEFSDGAIYADGGAVECAKTKVGLSALVKIPACGHVSLLPAKCEDITPKVLWECLENGGYRLSNSEISAVIQPDGTVTELISAKSGKSYINGCGNLFRMFRDVPRKFDAWDIDVMTEQCEIPQCIKDTTISLHSHNALEVRLKSEKSIGVSKIVQFISLKACEQKLDFETTVDWKELHKLLKVSFATGIKADNAKNQIQFGYVERPTHRTHSFDADRFEVCNHYYTAIHDATHGVALLNDCRYGISMLGDELSLTLQKSGAHPHFRTDNHLHKLRYSYTIFDCAFEMSSVLKASYFFNQPVLTHRGTAPTCSYLSVNDECVVIETVKRAEDGDGIIVRMYEAMQGERECTLTVNLEFTSAEECDMLETPKSVLQSKGNDIRLTFKPFEIKTLRIK